MKKQTYLEALYEKGLDTKDGQYRELQKQEFSLNIEVKTLIDKLLRDALALFESLGKDIDKISYDERLKALYKDRLAIYTVAAGLKRQSLKRGRLTAYLLQDIQERVLDKLKRENLKDLERIYKVIFKISMKSNLKYLVTLKTWPWVDLVIDKAIFEGADRLREPIEDVKLKNKDSSGIITIFSNGKFTDNPLAQLIKKRLSE